MKAMHNKNRLLCAYVGPISGLSDYLLFQSRVSKITFSKIRRNKPGELKRIRKSGGKAHV
jgi:hypothetical protein